MQISELQNQEIINKGIAGGKIAFLAGCVVEDELYFSSWLSNGFYKMDLKTGICTFLGIFENETKSRALHNQAIFFNKTIWFIPTHGGDKIAKVNIETLEKKYISLPEKGRAIRNKDGIFSWEFKCCYKNGDTVFWLAPLGYNMLLEVDMLTDQVIPYEDFGDRITFEDGRTNFSDACLVEDDIWLCPYDYTEIVIFSTVTRKFRFISEVNLENNKGFIRNYKNWVIFLSHNISKSILLINCNTYEKKELFLDLNGKERKQPMYMVADMVDQFLILVPYWAHEFVVVDIETGNVQTDINLHHQLEALSWEAGRYQSSLAYGSKMIYISDILGAPLLLYDILENKVFYKEMRVNWESYQKTLTNLYDKSREEVIKWVNQKGKTLFADEIPLLAYLFLRESTENEKQTECENGKQTIGERIFLSNM